MARLSKIAIGVAALLGSTSALADPISIIATLAPFIGGTAAAFVASYGATVALLGYNLLSSNASSNAAKRDQAAAAAASRAATNASLQDRNVTGLSAEAAWQVVYGNPAPTGGSLVAILSSGAKSEFKHLVVVFAAHESQAIQEVYLDGLPVGTLDGNGWCMAGSFFEPGKDVTVTESLLFSVGGYAKVPHFVTKIVMALHDDQSGANATIAGPEGATIGTAFGIPIAISAAAYTTATDAATPAVTWLYSGDALGSTPTLNVTYTYNDGKGRVNLQEHLSPGGVDIADSFLADRAGAGAWTSTDQLSGYTYAVVTLDQNMARFQGGPPGITARLQGKKVYDFRTGTTQYSSNPALCLADFLMSEFGFGATLAQIDIPAVIAAANACDAANFSCDGAFKTDQDRETTKQSLEDCFGGRCHQSGGVWRITAGAWTAPVMSLTDADCAAPIQITQASYTSKARYNTVRGKFIDGAGLGVATDFTPWQNAFEVAADGLVKVKDVTLPFTSWHQRAQDLARMFVERSRGGLTIAYPGHMRLWPLQPGDRVSVTNAEFGWNAKTFRITDWGFHPKSPVTLQMVEDVAAYYNPAAVITAPAADKTNLINPFDTPALAGLTASSGTQQLLKQVDGTITTRVYLQWVACTNNYVTTGGQVEVQWRRADATNGLWSTDTEPGDASSAYLLGLPDGVNVIIRARFVNQLSIPGLWNTLAHLVLGKTEPPATPTGVSLTNTLVFWTKVADLDLDGYLIRSAAGSSGIWSRGTALHDGIITDSPWLINRRLYGVQTIMVCAIDTTGNISPAASATLDFGQSSADNVLQLSDYRAAGWPGSITNASVVNGDLVADTYTSAAVYLLVDAFSEPDVYATQFKPLQWVSPVFLPMVGGGTLTVSYLGAGPNQTVEYQIDGDAITDLYLNVDAYASFELYGDSGAYKVWPGAYPAARMQGIRWRVSIASSAEQGKVTAFSAALSAAEVGQTFAQKSIAVGGTRLSPAAGTPARNWVSLRSVQITPVADGSTAIAGRVIDFSPVLGALVQLVDNTGNAVTGTATIDIRGLADV